jgi:DNA-directed RNA polymerase subunit L
MRTGGGEAARVISTSGPPAGECLLAPATLKNGATVGRLSVPSMELRVVEKSNDMIRMELPRGEETLLIPLVEALQKEEKVVEARYYLGHPYLERPTLVLKTKGEKPQQILKRVLKDLADLYGDLLTDFEKKADKVKA